jgi:D-sedoheptulose 7-phosphate isomerase
VPLAPIVQAAERLLEVARAGGLLLLAGNGGSAATASHMALDLGKSTLGRPPHHDVRRLRAISLADPSPVVTAWANDTGFGGVYAEQVRSLARPGDAVMLLSVSGDSPNVLAAARAARHVRATVIALLGHPGGAMRRLADIAVVVPSQDYGVVEDVHLAINHMITNYLREELRRKHAGSRRDRSSGR